MGKHKLQKHHLYLGIGGMLAVTALVVALTFGLSKAQEPTDPCPTDECPGVCCGGTGTYVPPTNTYVPPSTCTQPPSGCMTGTWNQANCACEGGTYVPPATGATCPQDRPIKCSDGRCEVTQLGCTGGTPPTGGTCSSQSYACPNGQYSFCDFSVNPPAQKCPISGSCTMPAAGCGTNSWWDTATCMCKSNTGGYIPPATTGGAADPLCWDSTNTTKFASLECTAARARVNDTTQHPTTSQWCTGTPITCPIGQSSFCDQSNAAPTWKCGSVPMPQTGQMNCGRDMHSDGSKCVRNTEPDQKDERGNQRCPNARTVWMNPADPTKIDTSWKCEGMSTMPYPQGQMPTATNMPYPQQGQMPNNQRPAAGDQYDNGMNQPPYNYGQTQCVPGNHPTPDGRCEPDRQGMGPQGGDWGSGDKEGFNKAQEEQWAKMDEQNKQRQLKDMKMGVKGFKTGIKQFQKMVDKATKKNIAIPETVTQALEKANSIITTVTSAATLEAVLDAPMDEMPDIMEVLMEGEQTLRVLHELPKIQRQFTKQLAAVNKRIDKAERAAKRAKIVVTNTVAAVRGTVEEVQAAFDAFIVSAQEGGDMEDLFSAMQDVTEPYETVNEKLYVIEAAAKSKNIVRETKNKVSGYKREAKKAAPRDATVTSAITSLQSSADELQTLLKEEFNEEDFFDALETVYDAESTVIDALTEVTGKEYPMPFPPQPAMQLFGTGGPGLFQGVPQGFESMNTQGPPQGMGGPQYGSPMGGQTEAPGGYYNQGSTGGGYMPGESNPSPAP